jgi:hypothetical protein
MDTLPQRRPRPGVSDDRSHKDDERAAHDEVADIPGVRGQPLCSWCRIFAEYGDRTVLYAAMSSQGCETCHKEMEKAREERNSNRD